MASDVHPLRTVLEVSIDLPGTRYAGAGRRLLVDALHAFLAAGFKPIGTEVLADPGRLRR